MNKTNSIFPILKTKRLQLRKLTKNDAQQIFYLRSNEIVNQYILRAKQKDLKEALSFISDRNQDVENCKICYWAITLKGSQELIGSICLWNFSEDKTVSEIGYDLHPDYFHKGIMTEAIQEVISFGFNKLKLISIEAFTHKENTSSIKLLEKSGFIYDPSRIDEGFPHNNIYILKNAN
mgnify:CR=1 FL=1